MPQFVTSSTSSDISSRAPRSVLWRAAMFELLETPEDNAGWCGGAVEQGRHVRYKAAGWLQQGLHEVPAALAVAQVAHRQNDRISRFQGIDRRQPQFVFLLQQIAIGHRIVQLDADAEILELAHDVDHARIAN